MAVRLTRLVLMIGLAATPAVATRADLQMSIAVKPTAEIAGRAVTLHDIASVDCDDKALAKRLKAVDLCQSPLPGKTRKLTREQIVIALRRAGLYNQSAGLLCPPEVAVTRSSCLVPGEALFEAAREFVLSEYSGPGTVSAEIVRLPHEQTVPTGKLELRVKATAARVRRGRNSVPVEIVVDDQLYRMIHVPVLLKVVGRVPVSNRAIPRSEEITSADVSLEERDITFLPHDVIIGEIEPGRVASVSIPEGSVLRRTWVSQPLAIRSGDTVLVEVSNGAVRVTDKGTAVQDGRPGERIKVRLSGRAREIRGIVTERGVVQIRISRRK